MAHRADPRSGDRRPVVGWILVAGLAAVLAAGATYVWLGSSSTDDGAGTAADAVGLDPAASERLGVDAFAGRVADSETVVINVHTPYEGEIEGTELFVPYDRIGEDAQVPADRATPIALYCRSGRMSREAAGTLVSMGYKKVADLDGGMEAWEAAGRPVVRGNRMPSTQAEAQWPNSLRRPGNEGGTNNPAGFAVLALLVVGWGVGFATVLRRQRAPLPDDNV